MACGEYIERRNGGFYVAGTRVSLDSIVSSFRDGDSPETIHSTELLFPYAGTGIRGDCLFAFFLAHEQEVDANIRDGEEQFRRSVPHLSEIRPELYARLERARRGSGSGAV
jgi:hypothetical protein